MTCLAAAGRDSMGGVKTAWSNLGRKVERAERPASACFCGRVLVLLLLALLLAGAAGGQTLAHRGWAGSGMSVAPWWKTAVFYQLDPLSFQDSDGDGFGDLNGVTSRLDYLQGLGVDAIVLSPFELQPPVSQRGASATAGATEWEPVYGSIEDFDKLEQEASAHRMRLVVDLPLSTEEAAETTVAKARFWLSRGVGGLRLTARPGAAALPSGDIAERARLLRKLCMGFVGDRVLVGDLSAAAAYASGSHGASSRSRVGPTPSEGAGSPQLLMDGRFVALSGWTASQMRTFLSGSSTAANEVMETDTADRRRSFDRLSGEVDVTDEVAIAKMAATALLTGRESPELYYGQEIGMATAVSPIPATSGVPANPNGIAPTPMQWGGEHGFTAGTPWIEMGPNAGTQNVAMEDADQDSLLNWYRKLSGLRHSMESLQGGSLVLVETGDPNVVAWLRQGSSAKERPVLIVCNLSGKPVVISLEQALHQAGVEARSGVEPLASSFEQTHLSYTANGIALPVNGIYLGEILKPGLEDAAEPAKRRR